MAYDFDAVPTRLDEDGDECYDLSCLTEDEVQEFVTAYHAELAQWARLAQQAASLEMN